LLLNAVNLLLEPRQLRLVLPGVFKNPPEESVSLEFVVADGDLSVADSGGDFLSRGHVVVVLSGAPQTGAHILPETVHIELAPALNRPPGVDLSRRPLFMADNRVLGPPMGSADRGGPADGGVILPGRVLVLAVAEVFDLDAVVVPVAVYHLGARGAGVRFRLIHYGVVRVLSE